MPPNVLELRGMSAGYGSVTAVHALDIEVPAGAIVAVLGANGAGKSTTLRAISGLVRCKDGAILLEGTPIHGLAPDVVVRRGVAHVPEGRQVFPQLTVVENLRLGSYVRNDRDEIGRDIEAIYGYFPILQQRSKQPAGQLSGGEQQMLAIGRGLMSRPRVLLLDEPSLGLSPRLAAQIFAILRRLNEERGTTIVLVEQNATLALGLAHFGYVLATGRIELSGTTAALRDMDKVREHYLGL